MRPALRRLARSVRFRATGTGLAVVTVALVLASALLVASLDRSLTRASDERSIARTRDLAGLAASGALPAVVDGIGDDSLAQVVDADGRVLAASPNIVGAPAVSDLVPAGDDPVVRTMRGLPDDAETEDYRVWARRVDLPQGTAVAYVGPSLEATQETVSRLVGRLLVGLPALVALLAVALWAALGRALAPIESLRREVATVSGGSLDRRVQVPRDADEVAVLAEAMNAMLARLQRADEQQHEFVANASHDLRTPLTTLRAELETALADQDRADWPDVARGVLAEGERMTLLVDDLLFLARARADPRPRPRRLLDLDTVVSEEVGTLRLLDGLRVQTRVSAAPVRGDRGDLGRMVRNLLVNAVAHARSVVRVDLAEEAGTVTLAVEDDGPGVPEEHRDRVFERFYRVESARSGDGTGLGLAIARSVAEDHGGTARLVGGSRFEIRLPAA